MDAKRQPVRRITNVLINSILLTAVFLSAFSTSNIQIARADDRGTATPDTSEQVLIDLTKERALSVLKVEEPDRLMVSDIVFDQEWAFGIITLPASVEVNSPALYLFIAHYTDSWQVRVETEAEFYKWLDHVPETLLSAEAKRFLLPSTSMPDTASDVTTLGDGSAMLSLPWATGETWKLTGGTHNNSGCPEHKWVNGVCQDYTRPWSSLDFQGPNKTGKVRAAAAGTVYRSSTCPNFIRLDHANGWQTGYYHLINEQVSSGQYVQRGTYIGDISAMAGCGGSATGPHTHFSLRKSGAYQELNNKDIGGWTVKDGATQYTGCLVRVRDSYKVCSGGSVYNDGSIGSGSSLTPPTNVSATDGAYEDRTVITWTGVTGATSYEVWRHTSNNSGSAARLSSNATNPFDDTGGSLGKPYYYWVKACNSSGCSAFSSPNTGYRQTPGVTLLYSPALTPSSATCDNYWKVAALGYQGTNAYLTVNTNQSASSTNSGVWQPTLPTTGAYKVEAYIGAASTSTCSGTKSGGYTSNAKYTVYHATGTTTVTKDQKASVGNWLNLGTFTFNTGSAGKVKLTDLNSEANFTRIIFFNAMKFTRIELPPAAFDKVSPTNAATLVDLSPTLTWSASSTAIDYDYCIDTTNDNACSNWVSAGANTSVALSDLSPNTQYYWHVRSENAGGITYANGDASAFWTFTTQPIQTDDYYEENDSFNKAYDLSSSKNTWLSTINGYGIQADEDWYRINVAPGYQRVLVDARFTHSEGDIDLELYDASGNWLVASSSIDDNEYLDYRVSSSGTYYINVNYGNQGNQYDLWWNSVLSAAGIDVHIGGELKGSYSVDLSQSTRASYLGVNAGPVKITSTSAIPIMAAERVIYKAAGGVDTSFAEMMALPDGLLDTVYWLPWYNNAIADLDTQLRFANVSDTDATVHVYIGGQEMDGSPFTLASGASTRKSFPGVNGGPVKIESSVNLVAAERVIYKASGGFSTSFSEMMALSNRQVDTTYWLPWYNNVDLDTQLRFANISGSTATVHVYIGGEEMQGSPFTLLTGGSTRKSFAGVNAGPVKIVSDQNIVAAERVIYKANGLEASFTEMMALPNSQLSKTYWLPWYNNKDLDTQLRFANVSDSTATVHVYIGGQEMDGSPFTLLAGGSTRKSFSAINAGPVQIVSDQMIVAAERVIHKWNGVNVSFSEMMGLPEGQLDTVYWLPWYNNIDLDTQLRFGVP